MALNDDLGEVANCIKYYAGWADKIHGQVIETTPDKLAYTIREPVGVCGQIIPYVFSIPFPYLANFCEMEFSFSNGSVETWSCAGMR